MESKMNWLLQSSSVDFYDTMLTFNQWLFNEYKIEARLSYFLQDELRYIVKDDDKYKLI
jgi:DNA polymerase gamma 1